MFNMHQPSMWFGKSLDAYLNHLKMKIKFLFFEGKKKNNQLKIQTDTAGKKQTITFLPRQRSPFDPAGMLATFMDMWLNCATN